MMEISACDLDKIKKDFFYWSGEFVNIKQQWTTFWNRVRMQFGNTPVKITEYGESQPDLFPELDVLLSKVRNPKVISYEDRTLGFCVKLSSVVVGKLNNALRDISKTFRDSADFTLKNVKSTENCVNQVGELLSIFPMIFREKLKGVVDALESRLKDLNAYNVVISIDEVGEDGEVGDAIRARSKESL